MNLDSGMEDSLKYLREQSVPHGLECECLYTFFQRLMSGETPDRAAFAALYEWDIA
jgi:hypothetical protein